MFVHIAPPAATKMRREVFYTRRQKGFRERLSASVCVGTIIRIDGSGIPLYNNKKRRF